MLKKSLLGVSILSQILLVGFMVFLIYSGGEKQEIIEDLFISEMTSLVETEEIPSKSLPFSSYIEASGTIIPSRGYITISSPIIGIVENVFVRGGDKVEKNQPLFKMKDKEIYVQIKEKEALLNKCQATLTFLKKGPSQYTLLAKQKEIEEITLRRDRGEKEASIFEDLLAKTAVSAAEHDEKHLFLQITEKELEKADAEYKELNTSMSSEEEEIYLNDIEEKKASLKLSTLKLESSLIKAPMSGRVVEVTALKGEYLSKSGTKGVVLVKEDPGMIKVSIGEDEAYKIRPHKNLRAVAIHPTNPSIYFVLEYESYNPKMSIYKDGEKKLDLFFSFNRDEIPIYLEESFQVYVETGSLSDLSFLHYRFY